MKTQQRYAGQSFRRVQLFLDSHADVVGAVSTSDARKQLDAAVTQLDATVEEQGARTRDVRGENSNLRTLTRDLKRRNMTPISKYARSKLAGVPNFEALTPNTSDLSGARLIESARAMAAAAAPYAKLFVAAQFPADFLAQLGTAADAIKKSLDVRSQKKLQRSGATKQVGAVIRSGRLAVTSLDALVTRFILGNERLTEEWRVATRIVAKPGVVRPTTATTTVPPALPVSAPATAPQSQPASAPVEVPKTA
jgi:hypothetical protein